MNETDQQRINAIVGEALKTLVDGGAPVDVIGMFATVYPQKVAKIMGTPSPTLDMENLKSIIKETVVSTIQEAGLKGLRERNRESFDRLTVSSKGKRTSISVSASVMNQVRNTIGNKRETTALIQKLVDEVPPNTKNRSQWIDDQLNGFLLLSEGGKSKTSRGH